MSVIPNPLSPSVDDVAALIRARTKDKNGIEIGTFNDDTRPTDAQAQQAIDHQIVLLGAAVGSVGDGCSGLAQIVVAYGAAAEIELSYFPEQARNEMSAYVYLIARYEEFLTGLVACVEGNTPDAPDPDDPDAQSVRYGTIDAISGTVNAYYTQRLWPALPGVPGGPLLPDVPDEPDPETGSE